MYSIFGIINPTNDGCKIMLCTIRICVRIQYVHNVHVCLQLLESVR